MRLLISVGKAAEGLGEQTALLLVDSQNIEQTRFLSFDSGPKYVEQATFENPETKEASNFFQCITTATGLSYYNNLPTTITTGTMPPLMFTFDTSGRIFDAWAVVCPDPHAFTVLDNRAFLTATGYNKILWMDLNKSIKPPYVEDPNNPQAPHSGIYHEEYPLNEDRIHMNSICWHRGAFYISAFGEKTGDTWSTAQSGYIKRLSDGARIAEVIHPHSLVSNGGELYFCESSRSAVRSKSGEFLALPMPGYTRGLAFHKQQMVVGTSLGRKKSKSTGLINNPSDPGLLAGTCSVFVYQVYDKLDNAALLQRIDLSPWACEIFDILILEE